VENFSHVGSVDVDVDGINTVWARSRSHVIVSVPGDVSGAGHDITFYGDFSGKAKIPADREFENRIMGGACRFMNHYGVMVVKSADGREWWFISAEQESVEWLTEQEREEKAAREAYFAKMASWNKSMRDREALQGYAREGLDAPSRPVGTNIHPKDASERQYHYTRNNRLAYGEEPKRPDKEGVVFVNDPSRPRGKSKSPYKQPEKPVLVNGNEVTPDEDGFIWM
jgi:hypothetical protein